MKKTVALVLSIVMAAGLFAGCGSKAAPAAPESSPASQADSEPASQPAGEGKAGTMIGNIYVPTQEEAMAQIGITEVPDQVLCANYNMTILAHMLGMNICGTVTTKRPMPEDLKDTPTIGVVMGGPSFNFDFEKVLAYAGDMVLSEKQYESKLKPTLDEHGIPSFYGSSETITQLQETIGVLGAAFGKRDIAIDILTDWDNEIKAMQAQIAGKPSPTVLVIRNGVNMATKNSYVGSLFELLNINCATNEMGFADDVPNYVPLDPEKVLVVDPDYILVPGGEEKENDINMLNELKTSDAWSTLTAVKEGRAVAVLDTHYQPLASMDCIEALHELVDVVYAD